MEAKKMMKTQTQIATEIRATEANENKADELFDMYVSSEPTQLYSSTGAAVSVGRCSCSSHVACCCCKALN